MPLPNRVGVGIGLKKVDWKVRVMRKYAMRMRRIPTDNDMASARERETGFVRTSVETSTGAELESIEDEDDDDEDDVVEDDGASSNVTVLSCAAFGRFLTADADVDVDDSAGAFSSAIGCARVDCNLPDASAWSDFVIEYCKEAARAGSRDDGNEDGSPLDSSPVSSLSPSTVPLDSTEPGPPFIRFKVSAYCSRPITAN